jgi:hypothetical protein
MLITHKDVQVRSIRWGRREHLAPNPERGQVKVGCFRCLWQRQSESSNLRKCHGGQVVVNVLLMARPLRRE